VRGRLPTQLDELVAARRAPEAWEGEAEAGGVTMLAHVMGKVAANELVVHGWDLVRATQQPFDSDPASLQASFEFTSMMSVPVKKPLTKACSARWWMSAPTPRCSSWSSGLSGRDPSWSPARR